MEDTSSTSMEDYRLFEEDCSTKYSVTTASDGASVPKSRSLFVTYTAEIRSDGDIYMLGIDQCYIGHWQANERVEFLASCNTNSHAVETKLTTTDVETGCRTVIWGRYGSKVRFMARARRFELPKDMVTATESDDAIPGKNLHEDTIGLFLAEDRMNLPNHIWVAATYIPKPSANRNLMLARRVSPGLARLGLHCGSHAPPSPSTVTTRMLDSASDGNDDTIYDFGWNMDSVHATSDQALAHAKCVWNQHFRNKGRCRKFREHYGFARYSLKPVTVTGTDSPDYNTCFQVRIERVKIMTCKVGVPRTVQCCEGLGHPSNPCSLAPLQRNEKVTSTAEETYAEPLRNYKHITDKMSRNATNLSGLPLALKIKQQHFARWSRLLAHGLGDPSFSTLNKMGT